MNRFSINLLIIFLLSVPLNITAENIVVVVNKDNPVEKMNKTEVVDLFMGRYVAFPDGRKATVIDFSGNHQTRTDFYKKLLNLPLSKINAYWARLRFTGRVRAPISKITEREIIQQIKESDTSIGYINKSSLDDQLKVVFEVNE